MNSTDPAPDTAAAPAEESPAPALGELRLALMECDPGCSPRELPTLGTLVIRHPHHRYVTPAEGDAAPEILRRLLEDPEPDAVLSLAEWLLVEHGATVVLPVMLLPGNDDRLTTAEGPGGPCLLVGVIYDTPEGRATLAPDAAADEARVAQLLRSEVEWYDAWERGERFGYAIECWHGDTWCRHTCVRGGFTTAQEAQRAGAGALMAARSAAGQYGDLYAPPGLLLVRAEIAAEAAAVAAGNGIEVSGLGAADDPPEWPPMEPSTPILD